MPGRCLAQSLFLAPRPESGHGQTWPACSFFLSSCSPPPPGLLGPLCSVCYLTSSLSLFLVLGSAPYGWLSPLPCPSSEAGEGCEGALSPPSA